MTTFEVLYLMVEPFLLVLNRTIRAELLRLLRIRSQTRPLLLDAGGRKSPYTIGVPADIVILDLPRTTALQHRRNLGLTPVMALRLRSRRSNVRHEIFGDMTTAPLMSETFDGVIAAEVLEHVEADTEFVHEVWRVLKPGGFFLATTPNGDSLPLVPGRSLDHKRHYTRQELKLLLGSVFPSVNVRYAVRRSRFFAMGIRSWSLTAPVQTGGAMLGNFLNWFESRGVESQAHGTQQLIALATKPVREPGGRSPGLRTNASMILTDAAGRAPRRR